MQSVGEKLKQARLAKNLPLDEAYKRTKIHSTVLEALEGDRADNFLSPVYVKGFLKTYAQFLGLDGEKLLKEYTHSQKVETAPAAEAPLKKKKKIFPRINSFLMLRMVSAFFLALALIFYFRYVQRTIARHDSQKQLPRVKIRVIPATKVKTEDLVLEVRTLDTCWLRVKADNKSIFEKTLPKGRLERWQAKEKIELRIGKPEALEVFLNGKRIDLKKARVKRSLLITHEGIAGK